jgi:hypothetical protein
VLLFLLSEESVPVPVEQVEGLLCKLRPVPGALSARSKIERALSTRAAAVSIGRAEKAAVLDALNAWLTEEGFQAVGSELVDLRGAIEYDLGGAEGTVS